MAFVCSAVSSLVFQLGKQRYWDTDCFLVFGQHKHQGRQQGHPVHMGARRHEYVTRSRTSAPTHPPSTKNHLKPSQFHMTRRSATREPSQPSAGSSTSTLPSFCNHSLRRTSRRPPPLQITNVETNANPPSAHRLPQGRDLALINQGVQGPAIPAQPPCVPFPLGGQDLNTSAVQLRNGTSAGVNEDLGPTINRTANRLACLFPQASRSWDA
ncbi:hypothetical protein BKA70DRAFT_514057 [Coprinopsis sp. MPI-PUGE-AT-0042]|nr:hypothetical protein BKA70DRAFT_514057 [Coprinopsis sp. MPI-PUGE-AT-0042]